MKKWKRHRKKWRKPIHDLWRVLKWETDDQELIAGVWTVWPLRRNERDRPFDDRINDVRCCLSHFDDLLMMEEDDEKPVECL
jgi:hypothetical protein